MALYDAVEISVNWARATFSEGVLRVGDVEVDTRYSVLGTGRRLDIVVRNPGREAATLSSVSIRLAANPELVLEHGHQSWSVVRACRPTDARPERAELPDWVKGCHLSQPDAAGGSVAGDQFLVSSDGIVGFLDGRSHLGTVTAGPTGVVATALLDEIALGPGEERALEPLWLAAGPPGPLYSEHAELWGRHSGARVHARVPVGWCSWYQYFADVLPDDIRSNLGLAADHGFDLVQIDDGWQAAIGDWLQVRPTWKEGTAVLAAEIRARGLSAGIWTAPFVAASSSEVLTEHPDWTPIHHSGHPLKAVYNPGAWGGWALALDTTRPDVLDHLRVTFSALRDQGFDYHKVDFCYAAALPGRRADTSRTRAEALRLGLEAVRDGIGDDAFLLGCGCPFGPAVGVVDAMRVSPDVAPAWEADQHWPGFAETAPAAINAVRASVFRAPLHRRVFVNDPDCLLLRPTDTNLSAAQRSFLVAVVTGCGGFTVVSDDLARYTSAEWGLLEAVRAVTADVDTPLDIDDPFEVPLTIRSRAGTRLVIDWRPNATPSGPIAELGVG